MAEVTFKSLPGFSLGFDPEFQQRWGTFWSGYLKDKKSHLLALKEDPVLFIEMCCKTASEEPITGLLSIKQFELSEDQKRIIRDFHQAFVNRQSLVLLKSRQMGASWLVCAFVLWVAIFFPNQQIIFTSKDEEALHICGDPSTLMGKVEYITGSLPKTFREDAIHRCELYRRNFKINDTIINGQTGKEASRSRTASLSINDELAFNKNQAALVKSLTSGCKCNFFISTLDEPNDTFHRLTQNKAYLQIRLWATKDPRIKDYAKFRAEYIAKTDLATFMREIEGKFNTANALYLFEPEWVEKLPELSDQYKPNRFPRVAGLDVAAYGNNNNVLYIRQGPYKVAKVKWNKCEFHESVEKLIELHEEYNFDTLAFDEIGVGMGIASELRRRESEIKFHVVGVNVSAPNNDKEYNVFEDSIHELSGLVFVNLRARLYWTLREMVRKTVTGVAVDGEQIYINDPDILEQMGPMLYDKKENNGKIQIISKRKLAISPDDLDALMFTIFAEECAFVSDTYEQLFGN
jgi:phage terminase large subunit